jgi:cyclophilin family peptidyl-prolyl cis-trans isomerase
MLARQGKYDDCIFHRVIPNFMVRITYAGLFEELIRYV